MSPIIFPPSTAQALSLTSRVARFMAQLVSFSHERLQRFGKEAVERAKRREKFPQSAFLTCEYLGVPIGDGRFDAACAATTDASFAFEWRVKACGYEAAHVTTVRCDHLAGRGRSIPARLACCLAELGP